MSDSAYTILIAEDDDSIRHALTAVSYTHLTLPTNSRV